MYAKWEGNPRGTHPSFAVATERARTVYLRTTVLGVEHKVLHHPTANNVLDLPGPPEHSSGPGVGICVN